MIVFRELMLSESLKKISSYTTTPDILFLFVLIGSVKAEVPIILVPHKIDKNRMVVENFDNVLVSK